MFRGMFEDVKTAGRESLETMGEGVGASLAGLFGGSQSSQVAETHPPASVGEDGAGGTVAQQPAAGALAQMPGWAVPVGIGLLGTLTVVVVWSVARG